MNSMLRKIFENSIKLAHSLADLCFPASCLTCKTAFYPAPILFCKNCFGKIKFIKEPCCSCCGKMFSAGENHLCGECLNKAWYFSKARSIVVYTDMVVDAIVGLKFGGRKAALQTFQKLKEMSCCTNDIGSPDYSVVDLDVSGTWTFDLEISTSVGSVDNDVVTQATIIVSAESTS